MGLFDIFKKKDNEKKDNEIKVTFAMGPEVRKVDADSVDALDAALNAVGSGELMHLMDPRRINAFSAGGPATWSVGVVPVGPAGEDQLYVTYGNAEQIDPARHGVNFELSILVPARCAGLWAGMLLRQLVRYMLKSGRELKLYDIMPFPGPITRVTGGAQDPSQFPETDMDSVFLIADPLLPAVNTPRGPIEVRRIVGLYADEREFLEPWSVRGFADLMQTFVPTLNTDIDRDSLAGEPELQSAIDEGSRSQGSQFGFVAVPGVQWTDSGSEITVTLPGGPHARRIHRMVQARIPHGLSLLIHDTAPEQQRAVLIQPSNAMSLAMDGDVLILHFPLVSQHVASLATHGEGRVVWIFS